MKLHIEGDINEYYVQTLCMIFYPGEKFTEELPALGHAYPETWTVRKAATCLEDGVEYRTCSRCGKEETRAIKAVGAHQFGAYVVTKQPTVLETGIQTRTCAVCHATESAEIARLSGVIHLTTKKLPLQVKPQDLPDVRKMDTARTDLKRTVLQQIEVGVGIIEAGELCWADTH